MQFVLIILSIILLWSPANGKMYQWTDENGKIYFSDKQPADDAMNVKEMRSVEDKQKEYYSIKKTGGLTLETWGWSEAGNYIRINGVVRNESNQTFTFVKIILTVMTASGKFIGVDDVYLKPHTIAPNNSGVFIAYIKGRCKGSLKLRHQFDHR